MVKGGDSCSEGCGFESQHLILDEHLFSLNCCKNCFFVEKTTDKKRPGKAHLFLKKQCKVNGD